MDGESLRVLDLSYGGVKFESRRDHFPAIFIVNFSSFDLPVQVRTVWSHRISPGLWWWGAEVADVRTMSEVWWPLVDSANAGP